MVKGKDANIYPDINHVRAPAAHSIAQRKESPAISSLKEFHSLSFTPPPARVLVLRGNSLTPPARRPSRWPSSRRTIR